MTETISGPKGKGMRGSLTRAGMLFILAFRWETNAGPAIEPRHGSSPRLCFHAVLLKEVHFSKSSLSFPRLIVLIRIWLRDSDDTKEIMMEYAERETFICMELEGRNGLNGWPKKRDKRDIKSSALGFCRHCGHMVFVEQNWIMLCSLGIMYSSGRSCSSTWKTWS